MAIFSLATTWALWSLLLLSTDQRQALAIPAPGEHHDFYNHNDYNEHHHAEQPAFYTARPCTKATFSAVLPGIATVEFVANVSANGQYGEGPKDLGFPTNATGLPPLCAVTVGVVNGSSTYRFGLFLPSASLWNGRLLTIGSYSFAGGINWPDMGTGPHYGFATLSSDNGHNGSQGTLNWNPTTPEKLADWGYRSLTGPVKLGKLLTNHYYDDARIAFSYYSGCSSGGRQGLKEIQISPESFDGALVGAPAWDTNRLMPWITRIGAANLPETAPSHLDLPEFTTLAAAVLDQCDHLDGHNDSIISRPDLCELDWTLIDCTTAAPGAACLSAAQIATARFLYADAYTAQGDFIHSGYTIGSEAQWYVYLAFGDEANFDTLYERYWLYNDTAWNWTMYSDQTFYDSLRLNPSNATADQYNISEFRDRGGRVLMYQGLADGVVMPRMTTYYYNQTMEAMNLTLSQNPDNENQYYKSVHPRGDGRNGQHDHHKGGLQEKESSSTIQDFFRYFQIPGMQHCFTSPAAVGAPWMFAGAGQASLLYETFHFGQGWGVPNQPPNATHDALLSLMAWVENATAPGSIVASIWNANGSVRRTRPICVYPQLALYNGNGDLNLAENWHCQ
ncbi:hypothetical protein SBRCBS47491_007030 [Sporothrix bragantina]|uniref:Carboxylic ester hydrolase n=1 Tax=Sporothrix bragantina TaxID=671064 RepID=A0ABP0CCB8_9PEZI